jgi:hypothetical protein
MSNIKTYSQMSDLKARLKEKIGKRIENQYNGVKVRVVKVGRKYVHIKYDHKTSLVSEFGIKNIEWIYLEFDKLDFTNPKFEYAWFID